MSTPKARRPAQREDAALSFDVTQEIDPALAEQLRRSSEPTLTQGDFDDLGVELPPRPTAKR